MKQRVPQYRIHFEDKGLFQLDLRRVGGNIDLIDIDAYQQDREVTTLAAARSVQRSLERRGHLVQGIYERINIRESQEQTREEDKALHQKEWEWDEEREVDITCVSLVWMSQPNFSKDPNNIVLIFLGILKSAFLKGIVL